MASLRLRRKRTSTTTSFSAHQILIILLLLFLSGNWYEGTNGYTSPNSPHLNRKAMAGLWKLVTGGDTPSPVLETTPTTSYTYPMKEFTVYPKKKINKPPMQQEQNEKELLLMLKEDGSFKQYEDDNVAAAVAKRSSSSTDEGDEAFEEILEQELKKHLSLQKDGMRIMKGTWDYVDGKLVLAADRPSKSDDKTGKDTMLVGEVVAKTEQGISDKDSATPALNEVSDLSDSTDSTNRNEGTASTTSSDTDASDTHLTVPMGFVEVGKFMYPKKHKMFFEQPMFQPKRKGTFKLQQLLGSLNTQSNTEEDELVEKFRKDSFADKRFLLTTHPIKKRRPRGEKRWSIKYKKFVEDTPRKKSKAEEEREKNAPIPIRVMEVKLFANNTFTSLAGLGNSMILRGKWHITGKQRDQLWMQIWRFGFGRSVSGSTFSEGIGLTHNDEKTFWGKISYEEEDNDNDEETKGQGDIQMTEDNKGKDDKEKKVQVKGSVFVGWGLEPAPVAQFILKEASDEEEDDEEEDEEDIEFEKREREMEQSFDDSPEDDGLDWSNAFQ